MNIEEMNPLHEAYQGLRVLDLSQGIAGPYCGLILRQMGAEVIKVEPFHGDWGRTMGSPKQGFSAIALAFNRGKRSIALDAQSAVGRDLVVQLAAKADVVIQSFRPGVTDRLGFGYEALRSINPKIIYASISGFGLSGPYADRPGTDSVVQALTGLAVANSAPDGTPQRVKPFVGDLTCGIYAANAIAAALFKRERNGSGTHIDVSLLATLAALQNSSLIDHKLRDGAPSTAVTYPQGIFQTQDGYVLVFAMNNAMFAAISEVIGRHDWLTDERMATPQSRIRVGEEINAGVARKLQTKSTAHWVSCFRARDILYGEVKDYDQFIEDEQVAHLGLIQALKQPGLGNLPFADLPGVQPGQRDPLEYSPRIGEHSESVLTDLGYSNDQIQTLIQEKTIACAPNMTQQAHEVAPQH